MKKLSTILFIIVLFSFNGCEECELCQECESCEECNECPQCEIDKSLKSGLYTLLGNSIYTIDEENGDIALFKPIDIPNETNLYNLTFDANQQVFYSIMNHSSDPQLVEIDTNGSHTIIGNFTLNGVKIKLMDGLHYDNLSNTLYAAGSLNGSPATNDYRAESLMVVNHENGECTFHSSPQTNVELPETDMDFITFYDGKLYILDAQPANEEDFIKIFRYPYLSAYQLIFDYEFLVTPLFVVKDEKILILSERSLYETTYFTNEIIKIGDTHSENDFKGNIFRGFIYLD